MKTIDEMVEAAREPDYQERIILTRYPFTYAYDFMRNLRAKIMPPEIVAAADAFCTDPGYWSRGDMAHVSHKWAELEGITHYALVARIADAYLLSKGIEVPGERGADDSDRVVKLSRTDVKVLPPVKIELITQAASGSRTESMHLSWSEASTLRRQLTSYLTKHAIRD